MNQGVAEPAKDGEDENPEPAWADYAEWTANRYNPGYYLGGTLVPHLRKSRLSLRARRMSAGLLAIQGTLQLLVTYGMWRSMDIDWWAAVASAAFGVLLCTAAVVMYRSGRSAA